MFWRLARTLLKYSLYAGLYLILTGFSAPGERQQAQERCREFLAQASPTARPLVPPPDERSRKLFCYGFLAQASLLAEDHDQARSLLSQGLELAPQDRTLQEIQAMLLFQTGDLYGAENLLDELLEQNPSSRLLSRLGRVYYQQQRLEESILALEQALVLSGVNDQKGLKGFLLRVRAEHEALAEKDRDFTQHFNMIFDAEENPKLGAALLDVLEDAYNSVGADLNFYPEVQIPVLLMTRLDYARTTGAPDWSGGLYDGKIRMPVGGLERLDARVRALLFHEYTHAALRYQVGSRLPVWLGEGLAQLQESKHHPMQSRTLAGGVARSVLLSFDDLAHSWRDLSPDQVPLAYRQSYSLLRYFLDLTGWSGVEELLAEIRAGRSTVMALDLVLEGYGMDFELFLEQWQESL